MSDRALLLPGWGTAPTRLAAMAEALRADGVPSEVWPYRPEGTLDGLVDRLTADLVDGQNRVHLVGHSLGGIVAAAAALRRPVPVASVTTINAPWRGTWVSFTADGPLADALRWGSTELSELRASLEASADPWPSWLLLGVLADLATPATTALRAGASHVRRRVVAGAGHSLCLHSPRLIEEVRTHVATVRGGGAAGAGPATRHHGPATPATAGVARWRPRGRAELRGRGELRPLSSGWAGRRAGRSG